MSFSFVKNNINNQTSEQTLLVAVYELGKVIEYQHKARVYGADGYYSLENQKKEVSDLISMIRMYCEQRGWDFYELMEFGERAYVDRIRDISEYGKK